MIDREFVEAHLTLTGWRPVRYKPFKEYRGHVYGIMRASQSPDFFIALGVWSKKKRVDQTLITVARDGAPEDIDWWVITDSVLEKLWLHTNADIAGWE